MDCVRTLLTLFMKIDASPSVDEVYEKTKVVVEKLFADEAARNVTA